MEGVNDFHSKAVKKANMHTAQRDPTKEHLVTRKNSKRPFWGIHRSLKRAFYPTHEYTDYGGSSSKYRGSAVENDLINWIKNDYEWWHVSTKKSASASATDFSQQFLKSHPPDPWAVKISEYCKRNNIVLLHAQTPIYDTACNIFTLIDFIGIHGVDRVVDELTGEVKRQWLTCLVELKTGYDSRYEEGPGYMESKGDNGAFDAQTKEYKDSPHNMHQLQLGFSRFLCERKYDMKFDESFIILVNDNEDKGYRGVQRIDECEWVREKENDIYTELCLRTSGNGAPRSSVERKKRKRKATEKATAETDEET